MRKTFLGILWRLKKDSNQEVKTNQNQFCLRYRSDPSNPCEITRISSKRGHLVSDCFDIHSMYFNSQN